MVFKAIFSTFFPYLLHWEYLISCWLSKSKSCLVFDNAFWKWFECPFCHFWQYFVTWRCLSTAVIAKLAYFFVNVANEISRSISRHNFAKANCRSTWSLVALPTLLDLGSSASIRTTPFFERFKYIFDFFQCRWWVGTCTSFALSV